MLGRQSKGIGKEETHFLVLSQHLSNTECPVCARTWANDFHVLNHWLFTIVLSD